MKTVVNDATLSDMEAICLTSVILGVAWLVCVTEDEARLHLRTTICASERMVNNFAFTRMVAVAPKRASDVT
jgi:hypothetical protein